MDQDARPDAKPITIKKYANRRLYNTATSSYVTLDDLSDMVKQGQDFVVYDAKTGEEITRSVLTQIIFEEENKGEHLLPINFLRQLIRYYGDNMQSLVPRYLEFSIEALSREQEKIQKQFAQALGGDPFKVMEEQTRHNIAVFEKALAMFNPFAMGATGSNQNGMDAKPASEPRKPEPSGQNSTTDEMQLLREQLSAMQRQIDDLAKLKR